MSIPYSDTVNKNGVIQLIERNCEFNDGDITGSSLLMAQFTADVNLALDRAWSIILQASGEWLLDDSNNGDYPIITTNLVSGQQDYSFIADGSGNIILEIWRVMVMNPAGTYKEIYPVNQKTVTELSGNSVNTDTFYNAGNPSGANGIPQRYDKTANAIFLDPVPNYNAVNGLKIFIDREAQRFLTTDTTKKAGFAGLFHEYLALYPSSLYADRKNLSNAPRFVQRVTQMERSILEYYSKRDKDYNRRLIANVEDTR